MTRRGRNYFLSEFNCKKLSTIQFFIGFRQVFKTDCFKGLLLAMMSVEINTDLQFFFRINIKLFTQHESHKIAGFFWFCFILPLCIQESSPVLRLLKADTQPSVMAFVQSSAWYFWSGRVVDNYACWEMRRCVAALLGSSSREVLVPQSPPGDPQLQQQRAVELEPRGRAANQSKFPRLFYNSIFL